MSKKGLVRKFRVAMLLTLAMMLFVACSKAPSASPAPTATGGDNAAKPKEYLIGVNVESSGGASANGVTALHGMELLVDEVNAAGGVNGVPIKLKVIDNESDATKAITITNQLAQDKNVLAIYGLTVSPTSMAVIPALEQAKVPGLLVGSATAIAIPVKQWIFKMTANQTLTTEKIASFLKNKGIKKVGQLAMNNAFGNDAVKDFEAVAKANGLTVVSTEKMEPADLDVKAQLTKITNSGAEAIIAWAIPPASTVIAKNAADLSIKVPVIHTSAAATPTFIKQSGGATEGQYLYSGPVTGVETLPDTNKMKKLMLDVKAKYSKKYSEDFGYVSALGYDSGLILSKALGQVKGEVTRESLRASLENLTVEGINGVYRINAQDHQGLSMKEAMAIFQVKNGQFVFVE